VHSVLRADEQRRAPNRTLRFEGEGYGSGVSLFLVDNEPDEGPGLHRHPYSETWIVGSGRARFTADGQDLEAGDGDILVVGPDSPHKFVNLGPGRLDLICVHDSPAIIQEELEGPVGA
jgi:mannose-6-phosphate isomerase-like protein (cupin superfamily)